MVARVRKDQTAGEQAVADAPLTEAEAPVPSRVGRVQIRKKDFIDRAVEISGVRKSDARAAIEAALAVMADLLVAGEELNLPPLGKLRVTRVKDNARGKVMTMRLMHQAATDEDASGTRPLAET